MSEPSSSKLSAFLPLAALVAGASVVVTFNAQYPVRQWLLVRAVGYWALSLYWALGCFAVGLEIVRRVAPRQYRCSEVPFVGFPLGVLAFGITVFLVGLAHGLRLPFFVLSPLVFLGVGFDALRSWVRACRRHRLFRDWRPSRTDVALFAFGASCLVTVYLPILTPYNIQHDARWYHLPIAQQYVAEGAVVRFPEGWFLGAYPHLSSLLYTWALLLPAGVVHRLELAAHMEFVVFAMTVFSIPAIVRRILPGTTGSASWVGFFLFPGLFVYDSNLSTGADHIAAVFAPAGILALYPALRTLSPRHAALVGAAAAGAALTKYSAISVALPLLVAVSVRAVGYMAARRRYRKASGALVAVVGTFVVLWAPHWLKNAVWYGNPFYPLLGDYFPAHPWDVQAANSLRVFEEWAMLRPTRDLAGVFECLWSSATVGFRVPDGWHGGVPVFGFLFAATLYCVPFTRPKWRTNVAFALGLSAAFVWYWTNHHDRYLQACLPWFVAATVAVLTVMWREHGTIGKASVVGLVSVQLACGAGLFLLPSYFMIPSEHPLVEVMKLVRAGYDRNYKERFQPFDEWNFAAWTSLGAMLPHGARVLVHEDRLWVGLDAPVVVDEAQWQAGIRYSEVSTTADVYDLLRGFGITHVITGKSHGDGGDHGVKGNIIFWDFVTSDATRVDSRGGLTLWEMPRARPAPEPPGAALVVTCNLSLKSGLYDVAQIYRGDPMVSVSEKRVARALLDRATFLVLEDTCGYELDPSAAETFRIMGSRGNVTFQKRDPTTVNDAP